jgi:hypothetical protein
VNAEMTCSKIDSEVAACLLSRQVVSKSGAMGVSTGCALSVWSMSSSGDEMVGEGC